MLFHNKNLKTDKVSSTAALTQFLFAAFVKNTNKVHKYTGINYSISKTIKNSPEQKQFF